MPNSRYFIFMIIVIFISVFFVKCPYGLDEYVIVNFDAVFSNNKVLYCPEGFETPPDCKDHPRNSYGCDLNDYAGGPYIYLCQQKKKIKDLNWKEKPVSNITIIFKQETCGQLKKV